jgi:hypothetical protein
LDHGRGSARGSASFRGGHQVEAPHTGDVPSRGAALGRRAGLKTGGSRGWPDFAQDVFVDETAITTKMTRLRGPATCGDRLPSAAPFRHWEDPGRRISSRSSGHDRRPRSLAHEKEERRSQDEEYRFTSLGRTRGGMRGSDGPSTIIHHHL